jgi:hypothetical protein
LGIEKQKKQRNKGRIRQGARFSGQGCQPPRDGVEAVLAGLIQRFLYTIDWFRPYLAQVKIPAR